MENEDLSNISVMQAIFECSLATIFAAFNHGSLATTVGRLQY